MYWVPNGVSERLLILIISTLLLKVSYKNSTHWLKFSIRGEWKTSEHTSSQSFVGTGLDKVEGRILKWPTEFFFLWSWHTSLFEINSGRSEHIFFPKNLVQIASKHFVTPTCEEKSLSLPVLKFSVEVIWELLFVLWIGACAYLILHTIIYRNIVAYHHELCVKQNLCSSGRMLNFK